MSTIYCRHIRPSGRRCQSPALRNKPFCYYHASANAHHRALHPPDDGTSNILYPIGCDDLDDIRRQPLLAEYYGNTRGPVHLEFPPLEDANSVQLALSMILTVLGQNCLEPKRAATMLYALQIAAGNARNLTHNETSVVREIVRDDSGNLMSPDEDPEQILDLQTFLEEDEEEAKSDDNDDDDDD